MKRGDFSFFATRKPYLCVERTLFPSLVLIEWLWSFGAARHQLGARQARAVCFQKLIFFKICAPLRIS